MHTHNRTHTIAHAHTHAVAVSRVHSSFTQQALLDVYTIREEIGTVNGLTIAMVGVHAKGALQKKPLHSEETY